MSDQQQILPCVDCNKHHEQMLMLSCLHDPCINCAAIHYVENCPRNSLFYVCSKCKQQTQLDSTSVVQLQRVFRTLKPSQDMSNVRRDEKKYQYNRSIPKASRESNPNYFVSEVTSYKEKPNSTYTPAMNYQPVSSSPINTSPYDIGRRNALIMCTQHPQDELSYFCFSCNKPICPECAIHGSHRQHEVQTARRAIPAIKERLTQANQNITVQIGNLNHKKNECKQTIGGLTEANKRDHQMIKRQFTRLRSLVGQKEDEFLRGINQVYQRNCEQVKYCSDVIQKVIKSYTVVRQTVDNTLKKEDLAVLNEFRKRQYEAQEIITQNSETIQQSRIKSTKQFDYKSFEEDINQLSNILEKMKLGLSLNKGQY